MCQLRNTFITYYFLRNDMWLRLKVLFPFYTFCVWSHLMCHVQAVAARPLCIQMESLIVRHVCYHNNTQVGYLNVFCLVFVTWWLLLAFVVHTEWNLNQVQNILSCPQHGLEPKNITQEEWKHIHAFTRATLLSRKRAKRNINTRVSNCTAFLAVSNALGVCPLLCRWLLAHN